MSFLIYFAVLLFAAASALFGLDVLTAPLPKQHHPRPPIEQSASVQTNGQAEPTNKLGREMAAREDANKAKADTAKNESALTPVYPTSPGVAKSEVREVYPPSNPELSAVVAQQNQNKQPASVAQPQQAQQQPQQTASTQPAQKETTGSASAEPAPAQQASAPEQAAQPATQQVSNKCNIQACAAAYQSFSAADCTYQPFEGARRLCTRGADRQRVASQPAQDQQRSEPRQYSRQYSTDNQRQEQRQDRAQRPERQARQDNDRDNSLSDAVRRVKSMRNWAADDDYDDAPVVVGRGGGRRYIVVPANGDDW